MIFSQDNTLNPTVNGTLFKGVTSYTCKPSVGARGNLTLESPVPFLWDPRKSRHSANFLKTKFPPQLGRR